MAAAGEGKAYGHLDTPSGELIEHMCQETTGTLLTDFGNEEPPPNSGSQVS